MSTEFLIDILKEIRRDVDSLVHERNKNNEDYEYANNDEKPIILNQMELASDIKLTKIINMLYNLSFKIDAITDNIYPPDYVKDFFIETVINDPSDPFTIY